jgi:hypothetical protein
MRTVFRSALVLLLVALSLGAMAQSFSFPDIDQLEVKLGIRPDQKRQYDATIDATKRALIEAALAASKAKDDISKELAKDDPDYTALVRRQNALFDKQKPFFVDAGRQWDLLFKQLDERQLRVAKAWIRENLGPYFR